MTKMQSLGPNGLSDRVSGKMGVESESVAFPFLLDCVLAVVGGIFIARHHQQPNIG